MKILATHQEVGALGKHAFKQTPTLATSAMSSEQHFMWQAQAATSQM